MIRFLHIKLFKKVGCTYMLCVSFQSGVTMRINIVLKVVICELNKVNNFKSTQCQTRLLLVTVILNFRKQNPMGAYKSHLRACTLWRNIWTRSLIEDIVLAFLSFFSSSASALLQHNLYTGNFMNLRCICDGIW